MLPSLVRKSPLTKSTQNSLDLLAYDTDDSSLIVIELKREKNKLQLLQALSYAAMVANWEKETVIKHIKDQQLPDYEELIGIVESTDLNSEIKVILIAERFGPEVIVTADWLSTYGLNIYAYALNVHNHGEDNLLTIEQKYPLTDLVDAYETRISSRRKKSSNVEVTWDQVIEKCNYDFAERAIEMCAGMKEGDPARSRFGNMALDFQGFDSLTFYFRQKYVNIYLFGGDEEKFDELKAKFTSEIKVSSWRDGFSFIIETEQQFSEFVSFDDRFEF